MQRWRRTDDDGWREEEESSFIDLAMMAAHAVPLLVAALLLLLLCLSLCTLLWLVVAAHAGAGTDDGAHARGVQAGEAEDVAVGEGAQA
jgi:hypothetical protein